MSVYAPVKRVGSDAFWYELDDCLRSYGEDVRLCVLGDFNARVGVRGNCDVDD